MKHPTAKVKYITATKATTLGNLLNQHLPYHNSDAIISSGGVWQNQQRLLDGAIEIQKQATIKVYISPTQGYHYAFSEELIIEETDEWVIVYKEPLITVAMDRSNQYYNLMAGLNEFYGHHDITNGVQPITRLDYRVSGLTLFSKTKQAERYLFKQMQQRRIKKRYQMVVDGLNYAPWYRVNNRLGSTYKAHASEDGKVAKTAFVKLEQTDDQTIFNVSTQTGRRHQIRCHAAMVVSPIVNDELYGYHSKSRHAPIGLLASELSFRWNKKMIHIVLDNKWRNEWLKGLCYQ